MKKPLVILAGPTAAGKTKASILLARQIGGEIISADSVQVYREMDIGSAKISPPEMEGIPHHLIDVLNPDEDFNVACFKQMAMDKMEQIYSRNHVPIVVGGTGFYIQALLYDIDFTKAAGEDDGYRKELNAFADRYGELALHDQLRLLDPTAAQEIHPHNIKRVIRALEYFQQTGERISDHNVRERQKVSPYNAAYFVLNDERQKLYRRIDERVDEMISAGLLAEVKNLVNSGYGRDLVSMQALGYKEMLDYMYGDCTLEEAVRLIKRDTRHFAKRQITWFKREPDVIWIDQDKCHYDDMVIQKEMLSVLRERKIIE